MDSNTLFLIVLGAPIFLLALTIHEVAHALTANWGGDLTATYQNRLSLNPLVHIDPIGTILVPVFSMMSGWALFGWAKPVPVDEANFRDRAWNVVVALAGPFSNLLQVLFGTAILTLVAGVALELQSVVGFQIPDDVLTIYAFFTLLFVQINWVLCLFNLFPFPPLDGSHVVYHFFIRGKIGRDAFWDFMRRFGIFILLGLFWVTPLGTVLGKVVMWLTFGTLRLFSFPLL